MDINQLRTQIDEVDAQLIEYYKRRMELSEKIGAYKKRTGLPVTDAARERELISDRVSRLEDERLEPGLRRFFSMLMETGKELQREQIKTASSAGASAAAKEAVCAKSESAAATLNNAACGPVAFQGIRGAYSEQAARLFFGENTQLLPCRSFGDVFSAVETGRARRGVVPVENLLTGGITEIFDLLEEHRCVIAGECAVRIDHCLLGLKGAPLSNIGSVASHPQGLLQCSDFLDAHPEWQRVVRLNTAEAALYVSQGGDARAAAIAGSYAARSYGLNVLARDISNAPDNRTRFIVLAPEANGASGSKYTLCMVLPETIGTLRAALDILNEGGFSLTFIQSRPFPGRSWEYRFFIDCVAVGQDCDMGRTLARLSASGAQARLLGRYAPAGGDAQ